MTTAPAVNLKPKVELGGDVVILTFADGEIRTEENMIAKGLGELPHEPGRHHLLLDFSNVTYINSAELGTLICLHREMRAAGGQLTLFNLASMVHEVFTVTRLDTLLDICRPQL